MSDGPTFACPYCDRQYGFKPELEGKRVRCKCGEKFIVEPPQLEEPAPYGLDESTSDDDGPDWSLLTGSSGEQPEPTGSSTRVSCPSCGSSISPTAALCVNCGKEVKTGKKVGQTRVLPGEKASRSETFSAMQTKITGIGLAMHGLGYLLLMIGVTLAVIGQAQVNGGNPTGDTFLMIAGIFTLIGLPLLVLGPLLSLAAPADAGRMLLIASIAFYLGGAVFVALIEFGVLHEWFAIAQNIPFLVGAGCFLGFLQKLSLYLDDDSLFAQTEFLLKTFFLIVILTLLMFIPLLGCLAVLAALVAQFVFAIAYAWTVCQAALSALRT